ncbi:glycosyltransferase family 39 protein [Tenacibaculum sp. M341]|uniref:glycosyltransferase family 39 protein n=1 Tax=Tenacibaculum sp. M341 TaxID=2530339 RepID=UPI00104F9991|nr:glycosyltransferase family 39 protein [Tenacibaculum sp. M341]TCI94929.1 glycosyltransferase family 39 protein [Tenacibaculum sp. M341]
MNKLLPLIKKHPAISIVIGFQLFRFLLIPFMGLMPQDAYYHFYGENLSWSYFDHPGMIGYLLRSFTFVFGKSVFVVKLADFVITSLTLFSFYKLGSYFLSTEKLNKAIVLITSTFFISILSFNSTPDVPLLLFWTLSVLFLYKAIFEERNMYWIYAGVAMGLAFNSKYTALLLQFGLLAFVVFSKKYRKLIRSPWLWTSIFISILVTFPVWYWNYQHDFASFLFQSSNRTSSISKFKISPSFFFGAIGHQLFLLLPFLFVIFIFFTFKYLKRFFTTFKLPNSKTLFLLAFFIPTFLGFFSLTPIYWVKLNWLMPSYITGIILGSIFISKKFVKYQVIFSVVLHLLVSLQILFYLVPIKSDDTWVGWEELANEMDVLQEKYPNTFIFSNDGYKTSAALNFFMDDKVYASNIIGLHALHFDYLGDNLNDLNGKNAFFIDSDKRFKNDNKKEQIIPEISNYFEEYIELDPIIISEKGKKIRKFWVYYCKNYKAKP